jgi:glycosyltransferase involved in cell wall biosynthesis
MRVALFHNQYRVRGGEERTVDFEHELLEGAGHRVKRLEVSNEEVFGASRIQAAGAAIRAPWNRQSYRVARRFLEDYQPDVSHVHNWFPLLSPSVYAAHRDVGVPVVQTLHNYRLGCAAGTFLRDGKSCEKCLAGNRTWAVRHRCYRGSALMSSVWARVMDRGWTRESFRGLVDAYIAPSRVIARTHVEMGLPEDRIHLIPHACIDPFERLPHLRRQANRGSQGGGIFVGRLFPEKGVDVLLRAWRDVDAPLRIVGTGSEEDRLRKLESSSRVSWLGQLSHDDVLQNVVNSDFLIFPSRWKEPFGLGMIEAMACGRPVIASRIGAATELVEDGVNGILVPPNDDRALTDAAARLVSDHELRDRLGAGARKTFECRFAPSEHLRAIEQLFRGLVEESRGGRSVSVRRKSA